MLFQDATLLHLDPPGIGRGDFRVGDDGLFAAVGGRIEPHTGEPVRRLGGAVVTPGLVSGHTICGGRSGVGARGRSRTPCASARRGSASGVRCRSARRESLEASALEGAAEAALGGVTALLDHHTPGAVAPAAEDALEALRRGVEQIGLRGVFSLGASERGGGAGRDGALAATRRFVENGAGRFSGNGRDRIACGNFG
jgi:cytosine/adenosine deaminase-related metal-dependent hydrolase